MNMEFKDFQQYKWFFTSSGKLVVGGKSALQNDELLKKIKNSKQEFIIMHTSEPGSPFTVIISDPLEVTSSDINQAAIFTGCFSRAWRSGKDSATIDIFKASRLYKLPSMKTGTWGVKQKIEHETVNLSLVLTKQKGMLRAVPEPAVKLKNAKLLAIAPGKIDKAQMAPKIQETLKSKFSKEEILAALPAGGVEISYSEKRKKVSKNK